MQNRLISSDLAAGFDAAADILCQPARTRSLKKPLAVLATVLLITASGYGARNLYLAHMDASLESGPGCADATTGQVAE